MRLPFPVIRWLLVAIVVATAPASGQWSGSADPQTLEAFAREAGVQDVHALAATVLSLRDTGRLPPVYVPKDAARTHGWRGGGLCSVWPGHVIGGDIYHNFSEELPVAPGRVWREADLDETCRSRGPKRLIFSSDGLIYVTVDHYLTFTPLP